ncbi:MAG TPA: sigma-70 family RNA polymerase sigma factor [Pirellulales bacterium]|jgi:RNA polymerase sigma factor (sigma-70 family)|nr:sigma-70 family RNA polymerase sigma factor [Pirellulales bacterium]
MIATEDDFGRLIAQIREGSEAAAWRLIELYGPHIRRVVRRNLDPRLRPKFDSVDFVQAVWASFFREPAHIREFETPKQIIQYLAATARFKVMDETRRRLYSQKHDVSRERPLDDSTVDSDPRIASGYDPQDIAIAREVWNRLIAGQTTRHQQIVRLRFAGASYPEIAERLEITERTARSVIERLLQLHERYDARATFPSLLDSEPANHGKFE